MGNKIKDAFDPFRRVLAINEPLHPSDDEPLSRYLPGIWPTWGELKTLQEAIKDATEGKK